MIFLSDFTSSIRYGPLQLIFFYYTKTMNILKKSAYPMLISVVSAMVWAFAIICSQNNLLNNKDWFPYAQMIPGLRMKAIESLVARYPVAGFRLTGGPAGFRQRVISKENFLPEKLTISFRLKPNSWMAIGFNQNQESFEGIRFSSSTLMPSEHFRIDREEKYLFKSLLPLNIEADKDHVIVLEKNENELRVELDGKVTGNIKTSLRESPLIVEVSENASVFSPVVKSNVTERTLSFGPDLSFSKIAFILFFILGCLSLLIRSIKFHSFILVLGLLWTSFDYFVWSKKLFRWNQREQIFMPIEGGMNFEAIRGKIFQAFSPASLPAEYQKPFQTDRKSFCSLNSCSLNDFPASSGQEKKNSRLMIVGGSMSAGWGISSSSRNYDELLHHELRKKYPDLETINTSGPDQFQSPLKVEEALKLMAEFRPGLLILELNLAAVNPQHFEDFLTKAGSIVPKIIYLYSPFNGTLYPEDAIAKYRELMKIPLEERVKFQYAGVAQDKLLLSLVKKTGVTVIDPRSLFLDPEELKKAHLFWDIIHLTDAGQSLLSGYLAGQLKI